MQSEFLLPILNQIFGLWEGKLENVLVIERAPVDRRCVALNRKPGKVGGGVGVNILVVWLRIARPAGYHAQSNWDHDSLHS